jgi:putative ABC transport system ATP-binding protein
MDKPARDPIFQAEHLSLAHPAGRGQTAVPILHDISLEVQRGGALALIGPSGSGKSTLLRCLNRLAEPTGGIVRFNGRDIRSLDPRELRRRAALVMQTPVLFEGTVGENLWLRSAGADDDFSDERLAASLADVGLDPAMLARDASTLSGGERQRVTIARAILRNPEALLLDEPTSALDPPNATLVIETVSRLREARRLSIVAVTHQPDFVRRLGGTLLYLVKGRVEASASLDGSSSALGDPRLQAFLAGELSSAPSEPR